jgi:radical SAM-linked protein
VTHLPDTIPIYAVQEVPLSAPAATQAVHQAEYRITIALEAETMTPNWQDWVRAVLASSDIWFQQQTKQGKTKEINLRDRLHKLTWVEGDSPAELHFIGSCQNDGTLLRPEHIVFMLEQVGGQSMQLLQIHRQQLILHESVPQVVNPPVEG